MKTRIKLGAGWGLVAVGHLAGVTMVAVLVTLLIMPAYHAQGVIDLLQEVPSLWDMSSASVALHLGLSACVWALICIIYQLAKLRLSKPKEQRIAMRLSRGSVMTETLVIFPIFFLLTFGMAQLAINNLAAILANVASYEAARAAWVWQPEVDLGSSSRRLSVSNGTAVEMCRIAVANVMLPVAPGEFFSDPTMGGKTKAQKARIVALGANIPLLGVISGAAPGAATSAFELGVMGLSIAPQLAVKNELSVGVALDDNKQFWLRTIRKFTHAFGASGCEIKSDHSVKMTYQLHITMPFIGPIFGKEKSLLTGSTGVGLRMGYFATFNREFGFQKQVNTPNKKLPSNNWINIPTFSGGFTPS